MSSAQPAIADTSEGLSAEALIDAMLAGNDDLVRREGGEIGRKLLLLRSGGTEAETRLERLRT